MASDTSERLNEISRELQDLLQVRITELTSSMRGAEQVTRQIVTAEVEIARYRQMQEQLEGERDTLKTETAEMQTRVRTLQENVGKMRKLKEELLASLSGLHQQMSTLNKE